MKTVLVAETQGVVALDIKRILEENNFEISSVVYDTHDLLEQYKLNKPDLIIVHLHLQGEISGEDAIRQINNIDSTPILIISSSPIGKLDDKFSDMSRCRFLTKPFDQSELLKMINKIVK